MPVAFDNRAISKHDFNSFDVTDERRIREPAPMDVGSHRATERQSIRARLLLPNAPGGGTVPLFNYIVTHQVGPGDPSLRVNDSSLAVEAQDAIHRASVEQPRVPRELLTTHRMTRAG